MWLSDHSVKRPVFATVISLLLVAFGLIAFQELSTREYPDIVPPVVSVRAAYPGASAAVVETRITQVLEKQIAGIEGIRHISSRSQDGQSRITVEFDLDVDLDRAAGDVRDRISRVSRGLPEGVELPSVAKQDSDARPVMYLSFGSDSLSPMELRDYAERYVVDRFNVIPGVSGIDIFGAGRPSMRIWLDRVALSARGLTVADVESALRRQSVELPAGRLESTTREVQVRVSRDYRTPDDFRKLVVRRGDDGYLVRLGEVARVELAPDDRRRIFRANGRNALALGVVKQSTANTVDVLTAVTQTLADVNSTLPEGMVLTPSTDDSIYIRAAVKAVYLTIGVTTLLVSGVILFFLGSLRAAMIPAVTIPVCLIASFIALSAFGFSINLITLLALVLCIGLVVDDAIVVVENVHRRIEDKGEAPLLAAYKGTRQVAFAVIATTLVLVAVFTPILFLKDNLGQLFGELAVTVSAAMIFSTVLALSLTPMMCSKLLREGGKEGRMTRWVDRGFARLNDAYARSLEGALRFSWASVAVAVAVVAGSVYLFGQVEKEYAPKEDQGQFIAMISLAQGSSFERTAGFIESIEAPMMADVDRGYVQRALVVAPGFGGRGNNTATVVVTLSPERPEDVVTDEIMRRYTEAWNEIPGLRAFAFTRSGLSRGGGGAPVQVALGGTSYDELAEWRDILLARAAENPGLRGVEADLDDTQPQIAINIDRDRAASLGISVQTIGTTLESMMAETRAATYVVDGEEYDIILQADDAQRRDIDDLHNIFVRSDTSGELIPLASVVNIEERSGASRLERYNRLRTVTITANLADEYNLADALAFMENAVRNELPATAQLSYKGESAEFKESSSGLLFTFGIALLVVFLVLAAQFESFIHPFVIMVAVPLAVAGGLLGLYLTDTPFNIFSQIGMIILIGIATKNGILIVEFINQVRETGEDFEPSIVRAARIRLRPVLMTTISTTMGTVPLILAGGAGSVSRQNLGVVMFFGVLLSALMTLYIVPSFYKLFARNTRSRNAVAEKLAGLQTQA